MPDVYSVTAMVVVEVCVEDDSVLARASDPGWRGHMYPGLKTRDDVVKHLAVNAIDPGATSAREMDGWADLDGRAATMRVVGVSVDHVEAVAR